MTDQRGCFGAVSTSLTGTGCDPETPSVCTYYLPGAPRETCSLPLMPTGPGFPSDYQQSNPGIVGKMSFVDTAIDFAPSSLRAYTCPASFGTPATGTVCRELAELLQAITAWPGVVGGATGFRAVRSLFLQNVYVDGADSVYSMATNISR